MSDAETLIGELRGVITDERVLAAVAAVPREYFVRPSDCGRAYENVALPISSGQTISQPLVVARMLELRAPKRAGRTWPPTCGRSSACLSSAARRRGRSKGWA